MAFDIVALGDVNMDFVVKDRLPFPFAELTSNGVLCWANIDEAPGGSALNFCVHARDAGYRPFLLAKVGDDYAETIITEAMKQKGIAHPDNWAVKGQTGKAIIAFDHNGIRLLINNKINANRELSVGDIEGCRGEISSCAVLYVSGYCVDDIQAPRFNAATQAMEYAIQAKHLNGTGKPVVVFDVVPHRIYERLTLEQFLEYTKNVDVLLCEVSTMRRFLALGSQQETVDAEVARETAEELADKFHYKAFALRFGPSGCDEEIVWNGAELDLRATGYAAAPEKRGFGDKLAIGMLKQLKVL
jgi:sugar/nucleoside kinase (ribokinase family)